MHAVQKKRSWVTVGSFPGEERVGCWLELRGVGGKIKWTLLFVSMESSKEEYLSCPGEYIKTKKQKINKFSIWQNFPKNEDFYHFSKNFPVFGVVTLLPVMLFILKLKKTVLLLIASLPYTNQIIAFFPFGSDKLVNSTAFWFYDLGLRLIEYLWEKSWCSLLRFSKQASSKSIFLPSFYLINANFCRGSILLICFKKTSLD